MTRKPTDAWPCSIVSSNHEDNTMYTKRKITSALLATLLLAACGGSGLSGTYAGSHGAMSYTFRSGGKVEMKAMGATRQMYYEVDGQTVKIGPKEGGPMAPIGTLKGNTIVLNAPSHPVLTKQ